MNFSDVRLNCIKGIPIDDVSAKPLHELGFLLDAPEQPDLSHDLYWHSFYNKISETPFAVVCSVEKMYVRHILEGTTPNDAFMDTLLALRDYGVTAEELIAGLRCGCVYDLSENDVQTLFEEFTFIIQTLLPRQLSDLYYSFDIQPNPAHSVFFDLAAEMLNIERHSDHSKNNYGQFMKYPLDGIERRISSGKSFQSIYRETCATKQMISDAWRDVCKTQTPADKCVYHLRKIEFALFKLPRKFRYSVEDSDSQNALFSVYNSDDKKVLAIAYLSLERFRMEYDYDKVYSTLAQSSQTLVIDFDEIERDSFISSVVRAAIEDEKVIENHRRLRNNFFSYGRALEDCEWNYDAIRIAKQCGCFSCLSVFDADEVNEWDIEDSGYCPYCGKTTVVADSQGYQLTKELLSEIKRYAELNDEEYEDDE